MTEWIRYSDKSPTKNGYYLITCSDSRNKTYPKFIRPLLFEDGKWLDPVLKVKMPVSVPDDIYWMPVPPPPINIKENDQ